MEYVFDDGGRRAAGYKGSAGDCVTRAIAIATGLPYQQVYDDLFAAQREWSLRSRSRAAKAARGKASPRNGVHMPVIRAYLAGLGWEWTPTMSIGSGTTVHMREDELPNGRLIVSLSRHVCAVIDGVVRDVGDPTREGTRCVYGYWRQP